VARRADAAARALHQLLVETGYATTAADTARLLRIDPKNISAYLAAPGSRGRRVRPRIDTLAQWCWVISQTTGLELQVVADGSGEVYYEVSGYGAAGQPIVSKRLLTNYRETDASPLPSWVTEWDTFIRQYATFYVEL
jgi:hypothetical protein